MGSELKKYREAFTKRDRVFTDYRALDQEGLFIPDDADVWESRFFDWHDNRFTGWYIAWEREMSAKDITIKDRTLLFVVFGDDMDNEPFIERIC